MAKSKASKSNKQAPKPRNAKTAAANTPVESAEQTSAPPTVDELRRQLIRKFYTFINNWRTCPNGECSRTRRCLLPRGVMCLAPPPPGPEMTPEEDAAFRAQLKREVRQEMARRGLLR